MSLRWWVLAPLAIIACASPGPDGARSGVDGPPRSATPAEYLATGIGLCALDGDSLVVQLDDGTERTVRLLSIDAPEKTQPLADDARRFLKNAAVGRHLSLEFGVERHDRYGRALALIITDGSLVNAALVEAGLAVVYVLPPNQERVDELLVAQARAQAARRGLWAQNPAAEEPRSFRERSRNKTSEVRALDASRWVIIGNASTRIAHWPGCRHVDDMKPQNRVALTSVAAAERENYRMEDGYQ